MPAGQRQPDRAAARAPLGSGVETIDSDFHDLHPGRPPQRRAAMAAVGLGDNVVVGDGIRILKGVRIGANAVIGAGSGVTRSHAAGVVAGNPAR